MAWSISGKRDSICSFSAADGVVLTVGSSKGKYAVDDLYGSVRSMYCSIVIEPFVSSESRSSRRRFRGDGGGDIKPVSGAGKTGTFPSIAAKLTREVQTNCLSLVGKAAKQDRIRYTTETEMGSA